MKRIASGAAKIERVSALPSPSPPNNPAKRLLQTALGVTQQHQRLAVLLRESVRRRLLHPGANTHQIIDVYIATIKVLRILDPKVGDGRRTVRDRVP